MRDVQFQKPNTIIRADLRCELPDGTKLTAVLHRAAYYSLVEVDVPRFPFSQKFAAQLDDFFVALLAIKSWYLTVVVRHEGKRYQYFEQPFRFEECPEEWLEVLIERTRTASFRQR